MATPTKPTARRQKTAHDLLKDYGLDTVPTVAELESKGLKVEVTHLRKLNGLKRQRGMYCVGGKNGSTIAREAIDPKGGRTEVKIIHPGGEIVTFQNCQDNDPYCRRVGVAFAIKKALADGTVQL